MHRRHRGAGMLTQPAQRHRRTQRIEHLLQSAVLRVQRPLPHAEVQIVPRDAIAIGHFRRHLAQSGAKRLVAAVDDRRHQPFDEHRVARHQQAQRLRQIPAVHVEQADQRRFDHIAGAPRGQIGLQAGHVDETAVVVGVRRRETPSTATTFDGQPDGHGVLGRHPIELGVDGGHHGRVHRIGDGAQ